MAHTLIYCHLRPFAHTQPFPLKKIKKTQTKNVFKFHLFIPLTFYL